MLNRYIWKESGGCSLVSLTTLGERVRSSFDFYERPHWGGRIDIFDPSVGKVMMKPQFTEADMKLERIKWRRTKGGQHLLLDKVYDAVTEEFTRDAMASLATVLAHLCIVTDVAKSEATEAFDNAYDEARDMLSESSANACLLN